MRVAVIGARQTRTGTGAHLARLFAQEGADVVALFGTSESSAREAVAAFAAKTGTAARAVWDREALLALELDAVAIAAPDEQHAGWIAQALAAGFHVLCEKPLVWGSEDPAQSAQFLSELAQQQRLLLRVVAQWPFTLATYEELFPGVIAQASSFFMHLSPTVTGPAMFRVSLSHPLSLLAAVLPDMEARVVHPEVQLAATGEEGSIQFAYVGAGRRIDCTVQLVQQAAPPREAAYGFDDRIAHRRIHGPDYTLELEGEERRIPMPDPTRLLVRSFLDEVAIDQYRLVDPAVDPGMRQLVALMAAVPDEDSPTP